MINKQAEESVLIVSNLVDKMRGMPLAQVKENLKEMSESGLIYQTEIDAVMAKLQEINQQLDTLSQQQTPGSESLMQPEQEQQKEEEGDQVVYDTETKPEEYDVGPAEEKVPETENEDVTELSLPEERALILALRKGSFPDSAKKLADHLIAEGLVKQEKDGSLQLSEKGTSYAEQIAPKAKTGSIKKKVLPDNKEENLDKAWAAYKRGDITFEKLKAICEGYEEEFDQIEKDNSKIIYSK